jgi:hypothetical protein
MSNFGSHGEILMHVNTEREVYHEIVTFWCVSLGSHGEILMHVNTEREIWQ